MGQKLIRTKLKKVNRADKLRMPADSGEYYEFHVRNIKAVVCQLTNRL